MPNWIENKIYLQGDKEKINEMLENIKYDGMSIGTVDFNKIIPMPEELDIECGYHTDKGLEMVKNYLKEHLDEHLNTSSSDSDVWDELLNYAETIDDEKERVVFSLGIKAAMNIQNYGAPTWYEWCNANWNTKWNACGYDENTDYSQYGYLWFQTAWSAPHPILEKLSEMYPDIRFEHMWADEDFGFNCGEYAYESGERIEEYIPETRKDSLEFAAKVWDYDLEELGYHINADGTDYVNTQFENYELITILDKSALFTNERLSPKDIPQGLNLYHFRTDDSGQISTIEPSVKCNHGGSVLMSEPFNFGEQGFVEFTDQTSPNFTGQDISIDDYVTENYTLDEGEEQTGGMQL